MALFKLCLKLEIIFQLFFLAAGMYATACQRESPSSDLASSSYKAQHNAFVKISTPQKHLVVQTLSCFETSTWFGSIASAESICPNLAHITWSAPGKFIVKEDGTTKKVLGHCTYYWNRLQVLKKKKKFYPGQAEKLDPFQVIYTIFCTVHQPYIWYV